MLYTIFYVKYTLSKQIGNFNTIFITHSNVRVLISSHIAKKNIKEHKSRQQGYIHVIHGTNKSCR